MHNGSNANSSVIGQSLLLSATNENFQEVIDEHLFVEALALCAFEVQYKEPQPNSIEKVIFLLERMN